MTVPPNLATDEVINEAWVDAVVDTLTALSPSVGGVVYGVDHYSTVLPGTVNLTTTIQTLITIAMPAAPAGSLLDIGWTVYHNHSVGAGNAYYTLEVNAVVKGPTLVVPDATLLMSHSARVVNVTPPVDVAYNITLRGVKTINAATAAAQASNTVLNIVSYRP